MSQGFVQSWHGHCHHIQQVKVSRKWSVQTGGQEAAGGHLGSVFTTLANPRLSFQNCGAVCSLLRAFA